MVIENDELVWGASGIRKALGLESESQVHALIRAGYLDGVVCRVGRKLVANRKALLKHVARGIAAKPKAKPLQIVKPG